MPDGFSASVDATALLALMNRLGPSAEFVLREVSVDTAKRIVSEAKSRAARGKTGLLQAGIHYEMSRVNPNDVVVLGYSTTVPHPGGPVDYWIEYGTKYMRKRPFFHSSVALEQDGHLRRMSDRMQSFLDEVSR